MARLNHPVDSDDESLPDISTILRLSKEKVEGYPKSLDFKRVSYEERESRSQKSLRPKWVDPLPEPTSTLINRSPLKEIEKNEKSFTNLVLSVRKTPKRTTQQKVKYNVFEWDSQDDASFNQIEENSCDDLLDFIVNDSASEEELKRPPQSVRTVTRKPLKKLYQKPRKESPKSGEEGHGTDPAPSEQERTHQEWRNDSRSRISNAEAPGLQFDEEPYANLRLYGNTKSQRAG